MNIPNKATRINLFDFTTPPMRAFHVTWAAFFLCFFAWFGIAPLMSVIRKELALTPEQIGWAIIASVAATVFARLLVGWLCDRFGPRRTYTGLLLASSIPVMGIGLANDYPSFLIFRLLIGIIGASFVITQYHTTMMFAPSCVGTANAASAGWGNLGGGVTQVVMPLIFAGFVFFGADDAVAWRSAMVVAGAACIVAAYAYYKLTMDTPIGNFEDLQASGRLDRAASKGTFLEACRDPRVWALFVAYGACFGVELTINNIAALYFVDKFGLGLTAAGACAASFGGMCLFARAAGGMASDRIAAGVGLHGRVGWLFAVLLLEGLMLMLFSRFDAVIPAVATLMIFGLFVHMAAGATYAVVPFVNRRALGSVAGIVGAGGNAGAVAAGFLFKGSLDWQSALLTLGALVTVSSFAALFVRLAPEPAPAPAAEPQTASAG